jgi:hypothetical protein
LALFLTPDPLKPVLDGAEDPKLLEPQTAAAWLDPGL